MAPTLHERLVSLPRRGVALYARISTPAGVVDTTLPTILFCHPTWLDSFFFYPQMEDPLFTANYNLVAFDTRGHGGTIANTEKAEYTASCVADDLAAGLDELGIVNVHVVGCAFGAVVARQLASRHASRVLSLVMVSVPPHVDDADTAEGYAECAETHDTDLLDSITYATFSFDSGGGALALPVREVRDEYVELARQRLMASEATATLAAYYIWNPVSSRRAPSPAELAQIQCPVLILQSPGEDLTDIQDAQATSALFNAIHARGYPGTGTGLRCTLHQVDSVGHYMTLTTPNVVNPLIAKFIGTPTSVDLPPLPKPGTRIAGSGDARRPVTPRTPTDKFEQQMLPVVDHDVECCVSVEIVTEVAL